jgi:hypothetical protein
MGWGMRFSSSNFKRYYTAYARTYGLLLFCCYFELFGRFLRPNSEVSALIAELRFYLVSEFRWPEMITFEELGLEAPPGNQDRYLYRYVDAHQRKRRMLKSPAKTTTLRHVQGLLDNLSRDPESAERVRLAVDRLSSSSGTPRSRAKREGGQGGRRGVGGPADSSGPPRRAPRRP